MAAPTWLLFQLVDSGFPAGAFAHSAGLEAAASLREVRGREGLLCFCQSQLAAAGRSFLPLVSAAHREPARIAEIDALTSAFLTNHVASRGSRAQGKALLSAASSSFSLPSLRELRARAVRDDLACHLAPVTGAVFSLLGVDLASTLEASLFTVARSQLSAAVRLGLTGPLEAQGLLERLGPVAQQVAERARTLGEDDIAQTSPLFDLLQAAQDDLYSRLFQS